MHKKSILFFAVLFLTVFAINTFPALAEETPGQVVINTIDKGIKILDDPSLQGLDKFQERKDRLWDILKPVFNFEEASKRSLGYHWKECTKAQQQEFVEVFTDVLRDIYLGKTDSYSGGNFEYVREIVKGNRGKVRTDFFTNEDKKVVVDFSMNNTNGHWRVYDVIIEGVSMVGNYREQFNAILAKSSFDELMQKLKDKREEFSDTPINIKENNAVKSDEQAGDDSKGQPMGSTAESEVNHEQN